MTKTIIRKIRVALKVLHDDGISGFVVTVYRFVRKRVRSSSPTSQTAPKGDIYTRARYEDIIGIDFDSKKKPWPGTKNKTLTFNWLMPPPGKGSGGHLNIFRFIDFLEKAGHTCNIYLYGQGAHSPIPSIKAIMGDSYPVLKATKGMKWLKDPGSMVQADGVFATSWETAYPLYNSEMITKKFYFVQDFEPYFYPVGSFYSLAEDTYKFNFFGVTAGNWLATKLARDYGMKTDYFDFGADANLYQHKNHAKRNEVLCYVRPFTERRGFENCIIALDLFHKKHPNYTINLVGWDVSEYNIPFPYNNLKTLELDELSDLYNKCAVALILSFTNMSLLPLEVLACGTIPVVNEGENNSLVSNNPFIAYSKSNPRALADAMSSVVSRKDLTTHADKASGSITKSGWKESGKKFVSIVERETRSRG